MANNKYDNLKHRDNGQSVCRLPINPSMYKSGTAFPNLNETLFLITCPNCSLHFCASPKAQVFPANHSYAFDFLLPLNKTLFSVVIVCHLSKELQTKLQIDLANLTIIAKNPILLLVFEINRSF